MVRGGVYEQFRGALLGLLWGIAKEDTQLARTLPHEWLTPHQEDWRIQLPQLLASWDQPLISVPEELQELQALLHDYLEAAWLPEPLPVPTARADIVRYALAIAPWDLELAHEIAIKQEPSSSLLLGCLFGAYWGALALPLSAWRHWTPTVAEVLRRTLAQWTGGMGKEVALAPKGRLHTLRSGCTGKMPL